MDANEDSVFEKKSFLLKDNAREVSPETTIPVVQEELIVNKKKIETTKIHISKKVTEHQQEIDIPLTSEQYDVVHVPIKKTVDKLPEPVRHEGDTMIISVVKEILVIEKKYQLVEEIHITKKVTEENATRSVTLRTEEVHIERTPIPPTSNKI